MTKREVLLELAARQIRLLKEIEAIGKTASLSSSHQIGNAVAIGMIVSSRLMEISKRPDMERDITFVEQI